MPPEPAPHQELWPWAADALYPSYLEILALLLARLWRRRHLSRVTCTLRITRKLLTYS